MARSKPKRRGIGAMCSIQKRVLHPSKAIREHDPKDKIPGWKIIGTDTKKIKGKDVDCVVLKNDRFGEERFYCARQFAVVDVEGPAESFFPVITRRRNQNPSNDSVSAEREVSGGTTNSNGEGGDTSAPDSASALPSMLRSFHAIGAGSGDAEDIARVRSLGFDVDDDNDPAPENVPSEEERAQESLRDNQQWVTYPFEPRKACNAPNSSPCLDGLPRGEQLKSVTLLWMFEKLMGRWLLESVIVQATNRKLASNNCHEVSYGEFLVFIGLCLLMASQKVASDNYLLE